jgi:molecular chaperone HtpG
MNWLQGRKAQGSSQGGAPRSRAIEIALLLSTKEIRMATKRHFSKEDIGGELLPILTTGLYRDTLDALREYIQNGIDASAESIDIAIDPDTIMVADTGSGMSRDEARRAIRLGISDKNPRENVGFRGIGIYSAYNLCDTLEIYTKTPEDREGSHIVFDFNSIRKELLQEEKRRKAGLEPQLYLEKLLEDNVYVEKDDERTISLKGSRVILSGLRPESYLDLQDWNTVVSYLQDVIPLPFHPEFTPGPTISKRFASEDLRIVPISLQIGDRKETIYRPYTDSLFNTDGKYPPKFFDVVKGKKKLGFAWVCVNGRRVLKEPKFRGLLIKKFGFSISNRSYLEAFFARPVFNRRITGEVIIQDDELLPNAARSDFVNNVARQDFLETLPRLIASISDWANNIQQEDKARQVLYEVLEELTALADKIKQGRRDKDMTLKYIIELSNHEHKLMVHKRTLQSIPELSEEFGTCMQLVKACQILGRDALNESRKAKLKLETNVAKVVQAEVKGLKQLEGHRQTFPEDLVSVLDANGIRLAIDAQRAIKLFESEYILTQLNDETYKDLLKQFNEALEEGI